MACEIQYNQNSAPIGVYNKKGNPSKLFQQILNNPHIDNFNEALERYVNVYENEQTISYRNEQGEQYNSFGEALKNTTVGNISAYSGETELFSVNSDTNTKSFNGLINNLIKSNLISDTTITDVDGVKLYQPAGETEYKQFITSDSAIQTAKAVFGRAVKRNAAGALYFDMNLVNKREVLDKNDNSLFLSQEQVDNRDFRNFSDPAGILAERAYKENNRAFGNTKPIEELEIIPENLLQEKLLSLLNSMGVTTVALEQYTNKYSPDAQALADIGNKIIAFKDGASTETLSEEVAHFIVEATPTVETENLLRNVHKTQEWTQYAETYRDIYKDDNLLRKEILGKVLANSFINNFAQDKSTTTENSIIGRLQDILNSFIDRIIAYFRPQYQQEMERYTQAVYNNLMADSLYSQLDSSQLDGKKYTLYSIEQAGMSEEYQQLERALSHLTNQQYQLAKKYSAPASQNQLRDAKEQLATAIETNEKEIEKTAKLKALTNISKVAQSQLNYLTRVVEDNSKKGYHFSQEENGVYQNYITKLEPVLAQISNKLSTKDPQEKIIKERIQTALKKGIELKGKVPENNQTALDMIINRVITKNNLTGNEEQKFREQLRMALEAGQKDTAWFHAHLGQLTHSQNIFLNLAGDVIAKTMTEARQPFLKRIKQFLNELEAANFDPRQLKNLIDKDGYIIHEYDNGKLEQIDLEEQTRIYNTITEKNIPTDEFKMSLVNELSVDNRQLFNAEFNKIKKDRLESFFTQEHTEKLENTFIEVNGEKIYRKDIPVQAIEYDQYYRGQLTQIRINNNGIYNENDAYEVQELNKQRVKDSNPRNPDGSIKNGLREVYSEELEQYIFQLDPSTITSEEDINEANKVYGLQMLNLLNRKFYEGSERNKEIPQSFIDKLNEFETEEEKWKFVQLNAYIGFQDDYWDNFGQNESLNDRLEQVKDGDNNEEIDEILSDIRTQRQIISNILRANRVFNQPSETNTSEMNELETNSIREASINLENLYAQARTYLPREEESNDTEPFSENRINASFQKDLTDEGITSTEDRINFILKHVTPNNTKNIRDAARIAENIRAGKEIVIKKSLQRYFNEDMSAREAEESLISYAESRLLPYYKRTEPIGYSAERQNLEQGIADNIEGTVESFITNSEFTQVSPNYVFYGQNEAINPRWLANRDAKRPQYTQEFAEKIKNKEFFERYGINEEGQPTKNLQEWGARQSLLSLQDDTIENYNLTGKHNRYLLPQQHKTNTRRLVGALKNPSAIRESLQELVAFREDEGELGQDTQGRLTNSAPILSVPTYGVRKLSNKEDVTDELLYSYAWMNQQSYLHSARRSNLSDMLVLQDAILNQDYGAKDAEATNAYKMFKSFLKANYYGVKETFDFQVNIFGKKVNLGKLAKSFNSYVRFLNLTGVVVPLTSFLQSRVQKNVENLVAQTTNPTASALARKEFFKYASGAAGEVMNLNSKSKINVIGEAFGLYDIANSRFENSNYTKATRGILQFASGLHSLGNFPVLPEVMLSVLYDNRYYNGEVVSYNQFLRRNEGKNKKEILKEWKSLDLFYDDILVKDGIQEYNKETISQKTGLTGETLDNKLASLHESLTNRINSAVQDIDTQIRPEEASIAARDARAAFLLMHSNWLVLALTQRLKSFHYDISRQTFSEGSWITTAKFLEGMVVNRKRLKEYIKETANDEVKRRNLSRTAIDIGVANALAVLAILLARYAEDDDDPVWAVGFMDYMVTRVANEQISGTLALPSQLAQTIENPIIAADRFYALFHALDIFDDTEITRGNYSGFSTRYRFITQQIPIAKDYHRLTNPERAANTYRFFNKDSEDYAMLAWFFDEEE